MAADTVRTLMLLVLVVSTVGCATVGPYKPSTSDGSGITEQDLGSSTGSAKGSDRRLQQPRDLIHPTIPGAESPRVMKVLPVLPRDVSSGGAEKAPPKGGNQCGTMKPVTGRALQRMMGFGEAMESHDWCRLA